MTVPNLAGFREAQERKRALLGEDITFFGEPTYTWPPGVPMDAQTGRPYDPVIEPLSSAAASAVIRCGVAHKAGEAQTEVETDALGLADRTKVMLIANAGAASAIEPMVRFQARTESFLIEAVKFDGVAGIDRVLVYGSRE
jgi:hypothetical protein